MNNILLGLLSIVITFSLLIIVEKIFKKEGLYVWISIATIIANVIICKSIDVFGFVTRTEGIKIHRMSCPNAARLMDMYPYRIQKVKWSTTPSTGNFQTGLRITAALEPSVINEIMDIVNSFRASIRMFNVVENDRQGTYDITMKIAVPNSLELDKVTSQIRNLRNVVKISRM